MTDWTDKNVQCPFYLSQNRDRRTINCESAIDGASLSSVRFKNKLTFLKQFEGYCCSGYKNCVNFILLSAKYENEG